MIVCQLIFPESPLSLALPCIMFGFANGLTVANATMGGISSASPNAGTASGLIGAFSMMVGAFGGGILIAFGADKAVLVGIVGLLLMLITSLFCAINIKIAQRA